MIISLGRAIGFPGRAEDQTGIRGSSRSIQEAMQHRLLPSAFRIGRQLEDNTRVASAATERRAIKIPSYIKDHSLRGLVSVGTERAHAGAEVMQYALRPASVRVRNQLEDNTTAAAAKWRRAIQISCGVEDEVRIGG